MCEPVTVCKYSPVAGFSVPRRDEFNFAGFLANPFSGAFMGIIVIC